jgi:Bacteriophage abortive infection AbiH
MKVIGGVYTDVIIIGNGFDLNLGFKTTYTDFVKSEFFQYLINSNNKLASHLFAHHNLKNWIGIEEELIQYSKIALQPVVLESIEKEYIDLCKSLILYLKSIQI